MTIFPFLPALNIEFYHKKSKIYPNFCSSLFIAQKDKNCHGLPQGEDKGALAPLEFEKMTSHAAVLQNILTFSLAPWALAIDALYFSLKHRKNAKISVCAFGAPKNGRFVARRAENVNFLKCW